MMKLLRWLDVLGLLTVILASGWYWKSELLDLDLVGPARRTDTDPGPFAGYVVGAALIALPFAWRTKSFTAWLSWTTALAAIFIVPVLPYLGVGAIEGSGEVVWGLVAWFAPLSAYGALARLRGYGRHTGTERDLPELVGDKAEVVRSVLERAGSPARSIRVRDLGSYNAQLQGWKPSLVVVDRRACSAWTNDELAAVVAHEVGHVRIGGILPYLAWGAVFLAALGIAARVGFEASLALVMTSFLALSALGSHAIELGCDRFAAGIVGAKTLGSALEKISADLPLRVRELADRWYVSVGGTHPPTSVRRSALGLTPRGVFVRYLLLWSAVLAVFVVAPGVLHVVLGPPSRLASPLREGVYALILAYPVGHAVVFYFAARRTTASKRSREPERKRRRPSGWRVSRRSARGILRGALVVTVAPGIIMLIVGSRTGVRELELAAGVLFLVAIPLAILGLFAGAFRGEAPLLTRRVQRVMNEAYALLEEGRTDRAIEVLSRASDDLPSASWIRLGLADALVRAGRIEEARHEAEIACGTEETRDSAEHVLAFCDLVEGELEAAVSRLAELTEELPEAVDLLEVLGLAELARGRLEEAGAAFDAALTVDGPGASIVAGGAIVELAREPESSKVDDRLDRAATQDPSSFAVQLALACRHGARGRGDESQAALERMRDSMAERGVSGWLPIYARVAEIFERPR